ncbi:E3 ubiquitin-protein ligase TRIM21-like isoform X1 [Poecilia reticulata]|uniref:E3 ubiquitin-protein ligase TRIM21-like isoform X1 n=2 Tax=Poecilia reticulata TaxID=8081 RepID=UPI0004A40895|nr:PREDICTED: E3 ubiquitin-protein ligase TRIM21-like isoform X1 [Poecilia reticulata]
MFPKSDSMKKLSVELLNTLKNLKQDDFEQFKWFLKQDNILEGQKGIDEDELEGAERWDTVDLMLRRYKGPGAKQLAINILQAIGQNNLVDQLNRFCEEQQDLNPQHLRFVAEGIGEKEAELEKLREFAVDVALDPDTAHRDLVLSSDGKQVYDTNVTKDLPMTSQRFDTRASVVSKETFSSGKFYIEVQVEGKTDWSVGVAYESINRKGKISLSTDNGFWTIWLRDKVYEALAKPAVVLPLKSRLQKVGIFVDYDKGLVSFYNVDTADLIYSYKKCSFKKKLLLYINTSSNKNGRNSAPMIITPVVDKINKATLRSIKEFAVEVTLDPDTAHPELVLSDHGKRVHHVDVRKDVPDNPKRFSDHVSVLGKQSFFHHRFYFEVQVKGKTDWTVGVVTESIERKGEHTLQPESGFWTICLRNGEEYEAFDKPIVRLTRRLNPERVGVFVDYDGGLVSFYNVDTADLLYSFTGCCFAERLVPFFSPCTNIGGTNSAPLIMVNGKWTELV